MRLDHIAYRVADRQKTANFFREAFGYTVQTEFDIVFDEGGSAKCIALEPPEKLNGEIPWKLFAAGSEQEYHLPPEIFISDGTADSVVGKWVAARGGVGGIHHLAYQVDSVEEKMKEWRDKGFAEFSTDDVLKCPGLTQVFTKPSALTGVIYEFINRGKHGFCKDNVKDLMKSTKDFR
ncbi:VOC family protein [Telmatocola sphagniphila]|uniref:VOC family protein n=1 Tax=Telmatocola sphagniphila TaxID=1123043 RepID=A0A8E6B3I5_9BACT|nr:VOC family protein [Telmatocola sphagniphila]QVL30779.1 VOC family protein [Telmatocola sphagniphila]